MIEKDLGEISAEEWRRLNIETMFGIIETGPGPWHFEECTYTSTKADINRAKTTLFNLLNQ
jgi:hypothetical protein